MIRDQLAAAVSTALADLGLDVPADRVQLERPANPDHGDWSTNVVMANAKKAGRNPWKANSLEWVAPSPPGHGNFEELPNVYRGPYEYSHPDREEDYWPQNEPA